MPEEAMRTVGEVREAKVREPPLEKARRVVRAAGLVTVVPPRRRTAGRGRPQAATDRGQSKHPPRPLVAV